MKSVKEVAVGTWSAAGASSSSTCEVCFGVRVHAPRWIGVVLIPQRALGCYVGA